MKFIGVENKKFSIDTFYKKSQNTADGPETVGRIRKSHEDKLNAYN